MEETEQTEEMEQTTADAKDAVQPQPRPAREERSFADLFAPLLGKLVTVVSPESFEDAPLGRQLRSGFYRAKLIGLGKDYITLLTEYQHRGKQARKEPAKQFIPLGQIKRLSMMKSELIVHI
jgi:hypothetical protein